MKILITGAQGQLGTELCRLLGEGKSALGALPTCLYNASVTGVDFAQGDLTQQKEAFALVEKHQPNIVINCAAYTNVDKAEEDQFAAFAANTLLPRNLALASCHVGAKFLHVSTDYVFSGEKENPYSEADLPAPTGVYGATKRQGEEYAMLFCPRSFVVRTSWLYARTGGNFVKTILRLAKEKPQINVVDDQNGNPTNAEDLAYHILKIVLTEEFGIYHCTGKGICTWHRFATEIVRLSGLNCKVLPCTSAQFPQKAKRPKNSALYHNMLCATVGDEMRPWQIALKDYMEEMGEFA